MNKILAAAALALSAAPAFAADPVWGMWKTQVDDGAYAYVEMKGCNGGKTCGWEVRSFYEDGTEFQSEFIGRVLVIDMVNKGEGHYEGSVWRPANGKTYVGKMELAGNSLSLAGCVLGGLICKSQTWTRVQ